MDLDLRRVPPEGAVTETLHDRRSGRSWSVEVAPFEIAPTVVTRGLWREVMAGPDLDDPGRPGRPGRPADAAGPGGPGGPGGRGAPAGPGGPGGPGPGDRALPAVEVSWRDAILFCNRLSASAGLAPAYAIEEVTVPEPAGWVPHHRPAPDDWHVSWDRDADGYRLPTEAEWQVACRAGTTGPHYARLAEIAWYEDTAGGHLHPVGHLRPNAWGLFDMLGGVWEWCWDLYDPAVYGPYRVLRGGGWADSAWSCRAGARRRTNPSARLDDLGFRLARTVPGGFAAPPPQSACRSAHA